MTDLTRETVSVADDYFQLVGVVGVYDLGVRTRLRKAFGLTKSNGNK